MKYLAIALMVCIMTSCSALIENIAFKTVRHPQNPKKRDYNVKQVAFTNPWDGTQIAGELTYPNTGKELKTIILVSGHSGGDPPAKRNYEITGHKYFLVLSHLLTNKGYAVLRYDNRGVGKSSGDWTTATDEDFASDAASALIWVRKNTLFKTSEVGFLGHSQGGFKAPMAALLEKPDFMVTLGSGVEIMAEALIRQNFEFNNANGIDPNITKRQTQIMTDMFEIIRNAATYEQSREQIKEYILKEEPGISEKELNKQLNIGLGSVWWYYEADRDIKPILSAFDNPVLELFGEKDLLVSAVVNAPRTEVLLTHPKSKVYTFKGLNHLFQYTEKGIGPEEYWQIKSTIEESVIDFIDDWLKDI